MDLPDPGLKASGVEFQFAIYTAHVLCMGISEICSVANGASKKEIGRATKFIVKQLEEDMGISMEMGTIHAGDFLVSTYPYYGLLLSTLWDIDGMFEIWALDDVPIF